MGKIRKIEPVKYFIAFIYSGEDLFKEACAELSLKYGDFELVSDEISFDFTNYYEDEMGAGLTRRFAAFRDLMDPGILPDMKIFTNDLEENLGQKREGELFRSINIDPGYVAMEKMVLASTKNFRHRIYLRDGIYAEATLYWQKGDFHEFEHTFPDYRTDVYKRYFVKLRERFREQISH